MTNQDDYNFYGDNYDDHPSDPYLDPNGDAVPVPEEVGGIPGGVPPARKRKRAEAPPVPEAKPRRRAPFFIGIGCLLTCCFCCLLPFGALAIGGVTLASVFSQSEAVETGSMDIALEDDLTPSLTIDVPVGTITVETGPSSDIVTIDYTKKAYSWNQSRAQQELEDLQIEAYQDVETGEIVIRALQGDWTEDLLNNATSVDLTITVPRDAEYDSVKIVGSVGDQMITNVRTGTLDLESNVGNIVFNGELNAENAASNLTTDVGDITIRLPEDSYLTVDADVDVGEISITWGNTDSGFGFNETPTGRSWKGTLGSGDGDPSHELTLKSTVGDITIATR